MPEGDTIHRTAATLRRALHGRPLSAFEAPRLPPPLPSPPQSIDRIEARGKHLLMGFSGGLVLHTHLGMPGSWHLYRSGAPWQRSRRAARAIVTVEGVVAVCFDAPVVEVLDDAAERRHPALRRLGPDLCAAEPALDDALDRMGRLRDPATTIGEALLDQRVAGGIGNVYRSEVCHLHGVDPRTPLHAIDTDTRRGLLATASELLARNLDLSARTTVRGAPAGSLHVYGRARRPCRTCGTSIMVAHTGEPARVTYWCPACQPARTSPARERTP